MPTRASRSLIENLIEIKGQLKADSNKSYEILERRDRNIGIDLVHLKNHPIKQSLAWIEKVKIQAGQPLSSDLTKSSFAISLMLVMFGLFSGISTALALFYYTGEQPINIINVLAIGVGLQLILLILFFVALLSKSQWLDNLLSSFNAGRWATRIAYFIPGLKPSLEKFLDWRNGLIDEKIIRWQSVLWSQHFAVCFNLGLILCCLYLVSFSDLAFGWSTTLAFDNSVVKSITDTLSLPWKHFFPSAVPSMELIDATRFYRLKTINMGNPTDTTINQAQMAGNWWRFLFLSLIVYGFIPRLITLLVSRFKLSRTVNQSFLAMPGLHLLLDRMNSESVTTVSETDEPANNFKHDDISKTITVLTQRKSFLYHWGQPAIEQDKLTDWLSHTSGAMTESFNILASDHSESLIEGDNLPKIKSKQALVIVVKAWEPPTLELTDWLSSLRQHYQASTLIVVFPYDIAANNSICNASQSQTKTWQDFLNRHGCQDIELHGQPA